MGRDRCRQLVIDEAGCIPFEAAVDADQLGSRRPSRAWQCLSAGDEHGRRFVATGVRLVVVGKRPRSTGSSAGQHSSAPLRRGRNRSLAGLPPDRHDSVLPHSEPSHRSGFPRS